MYTGVVGGENICGVCVSDVVAFKINTVTKRVCLTS